jgi:mannitol 2-dehydrogenase
VSESQPVLPLSDAGLRAIEGRGVPVPTYDRRGLKPRIVHVGVGGFHRAHLALYTDELAEQGSDWGIRGLGLMAEDGRMAAALSAQDHLYSLTEKGTDAFRPRIVGSIVDYRLAADDLAAATSVLADPAVSIVSLTITEAGYAEPIGEQATTCDIVAAGLERRHADHGGPVTILSCDNLPGNGDVTRAAVLAAARRRSDPLAAWLQQACTFPNSMVDRITPATTDADRVWLLDNYGIADRWPVVAEPFRQWVIEDRFAGGRPAWEDVGVLFSDDVHQWELYKLRMLNAGHSCLAYLAALAGITYVDEAMVLPTFRAYLEEMLYHEVLPTLTEIDGYPPRDYIRSVLQRFSNMGVRDQIARLCIDGTAKFPTFLIPTIARQLELGGPIRCAALALAGWARYLATTPPDEQSFDASGETARAYAVDSLAEPTAFLEFAEVFSEPLRNDARFREAFSESCRTLDGRGPIAAMMR